MLYINIHFQLNFSPMFTFTDIFIKIYMEFKLFWWKAVYILCTRMLQLYTNYRNYKKWPLLFSSKCSVFTCLFYILLARLKQQQILWMPCFLEDSVNWNTKNIPGVIFKTDTPMTFLSELLNTVLGSCNISCVYYS